MDSGDGRAVAERIRESARPFAVSDEVHAADDGPGEVGVADVDPGVDDRDQDSGSGREPPGGRGVEEREGGGHVRAQLDGPRLGIRRAPASGDGGRARPCRLDG